MHPAWLIVAVAVCTLVTAGAFLPMPGLLTTPLHRELGWSFAAIGFATWVNLALAGLTAPFAAALMDRFGIRRVATGALTTIGAGAVLTVTMTEAWQLSLYWGLLVGAGSGSMSMAFAATVSGRWFASRRGLVTGILSAAGIAGQLMSQPLLALLISRHDWRSALVTLAFAAFVVAGLAWLLLRDHPADSGVAAFGARHYTPKPPPQAGAAKRSTRILRTSASAPRFWLLVGTFAACGATTSGIMFALFVPAARLHGMPSTVAAALLAIVGLCNIAGTLASGWLTDRIDPRMLLVAMYALRAGVLSCLPMLLGPTVQASLVAVLVVYGLVDMGTVPPTVALSQRMFGADSGVVFGWLLAAHQLGAGLMALFGSLTRGWFGSYVAVWLAAPPLLLLAALLALKVRTKHPAATDDTVAAEACHT